MRWRLSDQFSILVIRVSLGIGGGFLAAVFILQAFLVRGFMIPAAAVTFVLIALTAYSFARIKLPIFSLLTLIWVVILAVIRL